MHFISCPVAWIIPWLSWKINHKIIDSIKKDKGNSFLWDFFFAKSDSRETIGCWIHNEVNLAAAAKVYRKIPLIHFLLGLSEEKSEIFLYISSLSTIVYLSQVVL